MGRNKALKVPEPRKLPSGMWRIQLRIEGVSKSFTAKTKKECEAQAIAYKAKYKNGEIKINHSANMTLEQAITTYIESREEVNKSPSTIRGYKTIQRTRFKEYMKTPVRSIDEKKWQEIINQEAEKCSPKTLKSAWSLVHASLKRCKFPLPEVELPEVIPATRPYLTSSQAKAFVKLVDGQSFAVPALLALHGLRRSEIMGLWWSNVDLQSGLIYVHGSTVRAADNSFVDKDTNKNTTSRRTVPIMIPELKKALSLVPEEKRIGKVVTGSFDRMWEKINKLCRENGLPEVGFHGLRHSFASIGYSLGVPELEMQKLGGWSDTKTMHKIYTHIFEDDMLKSQNAIAAFFGAKNDQFAHDIAHGL